VSRTFKDRRPRDDEWRVREHFRAGDGSRIRSHLKDAAKEYNGSGEVDVDPQDWDRRVGIWVD
jgi:hypothetical protein